MAEKVQDAGVADRSFKQTFSQQSGVCQTQPSSFNDGS